VQVLADLGLRVPDAGRGPWRVPAGVDPLVQDRRYLASCDSDSPPPGLAITLYFAHAGAVILRLPVTERV
jgi:hypothetical protein